MVIYFQVVAIPCCLLLAVLALLRKGNKPRLRIVWFSIWLASAAMIAFPNSTSAIAHALGIGRGADLVLYGLALTTIWFIAHTKERQWAMERSITALTREIAIRSAEQVTFERPPAEHARPEQIDEQLR